MENLVEALWIMAKGFLVVFLVMGLIAGATWAAGLFFVRWDEKDKEREKAEAEAKKKAKEAKKAEKAEKAAEAAAGEPQPDSEKKATTAGSVKADIEETEKGGE